MDGLDPNIMESMMGKGQLPNFERLAQKGFYSRLKTTTPPQSPVAWTSMEKNRGTIVSSVCCAMRQPCSRGVRSRGSHVGESECRVRRLTSGRMFQP